MAALGSLLSLLVALWGTDNWQSKQSLCMHPPLHSGLMRPLCTCEVKEHVLQVLGSPHADKCFLSFFAFRARYKVADPL